MNQEIATPERKKRSFVAESLDTNNWAVIEPYFQKLIDRKLNSVEELKKWLQDWSELDTVLDENSRWIYVRTTVDTTDEKAKADLANLYINLYPKVSATQNLLKKKFIASAFIDELDQDTFFPTIRRVKKETDIFREENIPLLSELSIKQSKYDAIAGSQSIEYNGTELTLQQAMVYVKSPDRKQREEVYYKVINRKLQDAEQLDELFSELIKLRHKIAVNAGYKNYMEYRFDDMGRFDYTPADCLKFHSVVEEVVVPIVDGFLQAKKQLMGLDVIKPWDIDVDPTGKAALIPFHSTDELIQKTITCFNALDPYFAERIAIMHQMNYLDLDSRMHKGPGGYNMTLPEIGVPFIFMNSANSEQDLVTMVHEGGHAIHTFLSHGLELNAFKEVTSEISEVASMAMELMSMEHWDIFYTDAESLKRAKKTHLQYILGLLAKTCLGDSFQFWLYTNPEHAVQERRNKWRELRNKFTPKGVDWSGSEASLETGYQSILHFYVVPFYYIEYAFAQLGALAIWRNFKHNPEQTVDNYKKALSLGYTKPIPVFYETAGAKFDFSKPYISGLVDFLQGELAKLQL